MASCRIGVLLLIACADAGLYDNIKDKGNDYVDKGKETVKDTGGKVLTAAEQAEQQAQAARQRAEDKARQAKKEAKIAAWEIAKKWAPNEGVVFDAESVGNAATVGAVGVGIVKENAQTGLFEVQKDADRNEFLGATLFDCAESWLQNLAKRLVFLVEESMKTPEDFAATVKEHFDACKGLKAFKKADAKKAKTKEQKADFGHPIADCANSFLQKMCDIKADIEPPIEGVCKTLWDHLCFLSEFYELVKETPCLGSSQIAYKKTGAGWTNVTLDSLKRGDIVKCSSGECPIVMNEHRKEQLITPTIKLIASNGKSISLTPNHAVIMQGEMKRAEEVALGDMVDGLGTVTSKTKFSRRVVNPLTTDGTIILGGGDVVAQTVNADTYWAKQAGVIAMIDRILSAAELAVDVEDKWASAASIVNWAIGSIRM